MDLGWVSSRGHGGKTLLQTTQKEVWAVLSKERRVSVLEVAEPPPTHPGEEMMLKMAASILPACEVASAVSDSLGLYGLYPVRLLCPWDSLGKNTGVGCYVLLQGIFATQGLNPCLLSLLHCRRILYH